MTWLCVAKWMDGEDVVREVSQSSYDQTAVTVFFLRHSEADTITIKRED